MSGHRRGQEILAILQKEGWEFQLAGNGHYRGTHPDADRPIYVSCSPRGHRARIESITAAHRALRGNQQPETD